MTGLHIIANFTGCKENLQYSPRIGEKISELVKQSKLNPLARCFYEFRGKSKNRGGYTGMILLAESHLSVHTWPEIDGVNIDVFVCNYTEDNRSKALSLYNNIVEFYRPDNIKVRKIRR